MALRAAPALLPAAALMVAVGGATLLGTLSIPLLAALAAISIVLGGTSGRALGAVAAGLILGVLSRGPAPRLERGLVTVVEGRVCGVWRERPEISRRSVRLCPTWMRQQRDLRIDPPALWLDAPLAGPPAGPGSTVVARGSLVRFAGFANEDEVPNGAIRLSVKSERHLALVRRGGLLARFSESTRAATERTIAAAASRNGIGVALLRGFVLGDEGGLPEAFRRAMRRTGLAHLLAVSGFNVTMIAGAAALAVTGIAGRWRLIVPLAAMLAYLAAVGPEPSLLRATLMGVAYLGALASRRAGAPLQALALAALVLVLPDARTAVDAGFQLSFGATAAILLFTARWSELFVRLPRPLAIATAATLAAQVGTVPTTFSVFREVAPTATLWNVLYLPWATLALFGHLAWLALAALVPAAATVSVPFLEALARPFVWLESLPPVPFGTVRVAGGAAAGLLVSLVIARCVESRSTRRTLLLLALLPLTPERPRPAPELIEVAFLDVGQGDATLIRAGERSLLVDGGGMRGRDLGSAVLRPALARLGLNEVGVAIVSHPDLDHCHGLVDLAAYVRIGALWTTATGALSPCVRELERRAAVVARPLAAGDSGSLGPLAWRVLHPGPGARRGGNRDSLVLRLESGGRSLLLTGDLPGDEESRLAASAGAGLRSEFLKVSHHGSASSSRAAFLAAVSPRVAVISAGVRNRFDHPAAAVLRRIEASGARVLRTDRDGEIRLRWVGRGPLAIRLPRSPRTAGPGG